MLYKFGAVEIDQLRRAMSQSGNVKKRAAELLGVKNYQTLDDRLKRLGIS